MNFIKNLLSKLKFKKFDLKKLAPLIKKIFIGVIGFIIILTGIVAGLLVQRRNAAKVAPFAPPITLQEKQVVAPAFSPVDPVSGDWGIDTAELAKRMNITLDRIGARSNIIKKFIEFPDNEFRYQFSSSLHILGESSNEGKISRAAIYLDPAYSPPEYQSALALIRAVITAVDPVLTREESIDICEKLGLSQDRHPPRNRQSELRHKNFVFRVWSVSGSSFVFTISAN